MAVKDIDSFVSGLSKSYFVHKYWAHPVPNQGMTAGNQTTWYLSGTQSSCPILYPDQSGYSFDTTTGGELPCWCLDFDQPIPGKKKYLGNLIVTNIGTFAYGQVMFCDRIWQSQPYSITGNATYQIHNDVNFRFPSRDDTGGNNGLGYLAILEYIGGQTGNGGNNKALGPCIIYTNHIGETGRLAVVGNHNNSFVSLANGLPQGFAWYFNLQPPDLGIRSVQQLILSGAFTPTFPMGGLTGQIVIYRPIEIFSTQHAAVGGYGQQAQYFGGYSNITRGLFELYSGTTPFAILTYSSNLPTGSSSFIYNYIDA